MARMDVVILPKSRKKKLQKKTDMKKVTRVIDMQISNVAVQEMHSDESHLL